MKGRLCITDFPTPTTIRTPPLRTTKAAVHTLLSTPVHSSTNRGCTYSSLPNSFRISFAFSSGVNVLLTWYVLHDGTISFAKASRVGSRSAITIGCAPEARAAARARRPIGPAPHTSTGVPSVICACLIAWRTTLRGSRRAPSAKETVSGNLADKY